MGRGLMDHLGELCALLRRAHPDIREKDNKELIIWADTGLSYGSVSRLGDLAFALIASAPEIDEEPLFDLLAEVDTHLVWADEHQNENLAAQRLGEAICIGFVEAIQGRARNDDESAKRLMYLLGPRCKAHPEQ